MAIEYGYILRNGMTNNGGENMFELSRHDGLIGVDIALSNGTVIKTMLLPVDYYALLSAVKYQSVKYIEYIHYTEHSIAEGDTMTSIDQESYLIPLNHIVYVRD